MEVEVVCILVQVLFQSPSVHCHLVALVLVEVDHEGGEAFFVGLELLDDLVTFHYRIFEGEECLVLPHYLGVQTSDLDGQVIDLYPAFVDVTLYILQILSFLLDLPVQLLIPRSKHLPLRLHGQSQQALTLHLLIDGLKIHTQAMIIPDTKFKGKTSLLDLLDHILVIFMVHEYSLKVGHISAIIKTTNCK